MHYLIIIQKKIIADKNFFVKMTQTKKSKKKLNFSLALPKRLSLMALFIYFLCIQNSDHHIGIRNKVKMIIFLTNKKNAHFNIKQCNTRVVRNKKKRASFGSIYFILIKNSNAQERKKSTYFCKFAKNFIVFTIGKMHVPNKD